MADSDSDSALSGDSGRPRSGHSHNHNGHNHNGHSRSYATSTDTQRAAVGLAGHKPATGGLLAVNEGVWDTEPVVPEPHHLGEISLDGQPGVEMAATRRPPSSPPSPRSTDPGVSGYAAPPLDAE